MTSEVFFEKWTNSRQFELAVKSMIRKGEIEKTVIGVTSYYEIDEIVMLKAIIEYREIILAISNATDEVKEEFNLYIKGVKNGSKFRAI